MKYCICFQFFLFTFKLNIKKASFDCIIFIALLKLKNTNVLLIEFQLYYLKIFCSNQLLGEKSWNTLHQDFKFGS